MSTSPPKNRVTKHITRRRKPTLDEIAKLQAPQNSREPEEERPAEKEEGLLS